MSDRYISVGFISRVHGYNGNVLCKIELPEPEMLNNIDAVFVKMGSGYVPMFTERFTIQKKNQALAKFDEIHSDHDAKTIVGLELFLPEKALPEVKKTVDYTDYVLFNAETKSRVGSITDVMDINGNPLAVVMLNDEEVYIPIHPDKILSTDTVKRHLYVDIADGLLEIN